MFLGNDWVDALYVLCNKTHSANVNSVLELQQTSPRVQNLSNYVLHLKLHEEKRATPIVFPSVTQSASNLNKYVKLKLIALHFIKMLKSTLN